MVSPLGPQKNDTVSWVSLNAYGVFIAIFALLLGLRYILHPVGFIFTGAGHIGYLLSGVGLLYSYFKQRIDQEVYASILLFGSNFLLLVSTSFGPRGFDLWNALLTASLALVVAMRIKALMRGGTYSLPTWGSKEQLHHLEIIEEERNK